MRSASLLILLSFLGACVATPRIVRLENDRVLSVAQVADDLVTADFVALGEEHGNQPVHETHLALIEAMYERRPNMVIAMEHFERDVHAVLLQYLDGSMSETEFLAKSRPWGNYERDYKPVIEFAKQHKLVVLAANAPRPLASKAAREGVDAVLPHKDLARETSAPDDEYRDACDEAMADAGHGKMSEERLARFYASQCLKDDTMAESLTDYLQERYAQGDKPLAVLICGKMHSDHGRGTVQRVVQRMPPGFTVRVLSAESVEDMGRGIYESPRDVGDYVIVVPEAPDDDEAPKVAMPKKPANDDGLPTENPEGLRPAFGFMPDYAGDQEGVAVGAVTEGSPAEAAGILEGDLIVSVDGIPTADIEVYVEVMDMLIIGRTAKVKIVRGDDELELDVVVGSRPSH